MASLYRDSRSKYLVGCFTAADGRQLKRSTKVTDRRAALAIVEAWEKAESMSRRGALVTEEQLRRILHETLEKITGKKIYEPSVSEWFGRYLQLHETSLSPETFRKYSGVLKAFLAYLGTRASCRLEALTLEDFIAFRDHLLAEGRSGRTVNNNIRNILGTPFRLAVKEGILFRSPLALMPVLRDTPAEKGVFTPLQVGLLIKAAHPDWEWALLILLGYYVGARLMDLARLRWDQVDLSQGAITFTQKKTGARNQVPIHRELAQALSASPPGAGHSYILSRLSQRISNGSEGLSMRFKELMVKAGIDDGTARERKGKAGRRTARLSFHSLRHSFTSALANAGVAPDIRQKLTGHVDAEAHRVYSHHEFEIIRDALNNLPALPQ
jgi:integrase